MFGSDINEVLEYITQPAFLYAVGAVLLLIIIVIFLLKRQPKNVVAYSTDDGRVMVSRNAIIELVQTSCEQLDDVSKPGVRIKIKGAITNFEVRLKLLSGGRMRDVEKTLQSHLRHTLTENLGIENLGRIDIIATGFKSGRISSSQKKEPEQLIEEEPEVIETEAENIDLSTEGDTSEQTKL